MNSNQHKDRVDTRHDRGVTLIELIVVLGMMAIIAAMAVTSLSSEGSKLRAAAYNLRTELLSAKAEAIKRNEDVEVHFDEDNDKYNATGENSGVVLFSKNLPSGLSLTTNLSPTSQFITFKPRGTSTPATVFINGSGKVYNCTVNSVGRVTIAP